ncbi:MAG: metal-dependent transcriptional regulator [Ignavibacteriae bacterium]|nr:metal-dependent transcriptional regulator [Ignavibacteriota bacterium]NOG96964.1 metal-dependent transcriptional regulator [Ignavibacteriota bacterium]
MSTISKENYLKTLYTKDKIENVVVTTSQIAESLNVSNAATSEMAKKLSNQGLVNYKKYKGIELTNRGEKIALNVLRRHRLWELFLMEVLNLTWDEVHDEAELLEHQTSENLIDKIDEYLNFPEFDPHGSPIPNKKGKLPLMPKLKPLLSGEEGATYKVARVSDKNSELIKYFTKIGLTLNKKIKIIEKLTFDNSIVIELNNSSISLSEKTAQSVFLK